MGERGKKAKKAGWQVQLGVKELIFSGLGVAGLVMMSFAVGTLAGRGDIYRVLHNWGLLGPESGKAGQIWYQAPPPPAPAMAVLSNPPVAEPAPTAAVPATPQVGAVDKPPTTVPLPIKGSIAAPPSHLQANSPQAKKKNPKQEAKTKEDKLEKIRQEVASKLKFQNSLDLATTRMAHGDKTKKGDKEHTVASKTATSQIVVARFRDAGQAHAKLSQMQKHGDKVTLKEGKDEEGRYFAIYRQVPATPPASNPVAQTPAKKTKVEKKPKPEVNKEAARR
jgi:hypothetical protein|uniref:Uncharacterized protein n=1 Tax=Desulfobacca acetoxidans TaxID=60893 RepID=A0A7C3YZ91_9BACT